MEYTSDKYFGFGGWRKRVCSAISRRISLHKPVYKETYTLYQYNDEQFRIVKQKAQRQPGFDIRRPPPDVTNHDEVERVSISRSRRNVRELALCNNFEYFATLTVNSKFADRHSLTECQTLLRKKLKALKRKNNEFAYLFITEKHKDRSFPFPPVL